MASKITPGPWQAINWTYHSTSTVVVDDASVVTGKRVIAECATEADARLIAAAPEMLEALRHAIDALERSDYIMMDGDKFDVVKLCWAAIKKATRT